MGKKKGGGGKLSTNELLAKQQAYIDAGQHRKAGRIQNRLDSRAMRNPVSSLPIGQQVAQENFQTNLNANRPNQNTIGGSMQYITDPNTGQVTVNQSLSPEQQALYDQQVAQTSAANTAFMTAFSGAMGGGQIPWGQAYDFSGAPSAPSTQDLGAQRKEFENRAYQDNMDLANQTYDRRREQMEQRLYETGNPPGTPGYKARMAEFDESFRQAEKGARSSARTEAGAEFERAFNLGQQGRQSYINEQVMGRTQPLQELGALSSFGGGPTVQPNFYGFQPIQYQGPEYLPYLQAGIDRALGWGAINKPTGGGGSPAPAPGPSFSIGSAPAPLPNIPNAPDPIASGFGAGVQQGVGLGVAAG